MALHFMSYSPDGATFANWLREELEKTRPDTEPLDRPDLSTTFADTTLLEQQISMCASMLFVHSRHASSWIPCRLQVRLAAEAGKRIFALRLDAEAGELPLPAHVARDHERVTALDFSRSRSGGLDDLRRELRKLVSYHGWLGQRKMRQLRKARELQGAPPAQRPALQRKVADIQVEIDELLDTAVQGTAVRVRRAGTAWRAPRRPKPWQQPKGQAVSWPSDVGKQSEFRDREDLMEILSGYLQDDAVQIVSVTGAEGIGKTRMVRKVLEALESDREATGVDAVIFLAGHPLRPVSGPLVLEALHRRLPAGAAAALDGPPVEPDLPLLQKLDALLIRLGGIRALVMIDGLESLQNQETGALQQADLDDLLRFLTMRHDHRVTVVLVSRVRPEPLLRIVSPASRKVRQLLMTSGLPRPEAVALLRDLDPDDVYGFQDMDPAILDETYALTDGSPKVLEALYGNLSLPDSPYTSLRQLLDAAAGVPSGEALGFLVGQMFKHLDLSAWSVAQALAIYGRPVGRDAIEELLRPYLGDHPIGSALDRLLSAGLVRQEGGNAYLTPPNDERVLQLIPRGASADKGRRPPPFTRYALLHQAAEILGRRQTTDVRRVEDLSLRLSQIDLLIKGEEHEEALDLIDKVDERYLDGWGYSQLLVRQRMALREHLEDDWRRLVNLNALGMIYVRGNNLPDAIECYRTALAIAEQLDRVDAKKKLHVNLASVYLALGWLDDAFDYNTSALRMARKYRQVAEEVTPLIGLAECYAHTGAFDHALDYARKALAIAQAHAMLDRCASLLLLIGRWHGQLGATLTALEYLRRGLKLAEEQGNHLAEGKFLDAIAEILIDQGRPARAEALAARTVEIGDKINSPTLRREAGFTLAIARLCLGNLEDARRAAERASAYRRSGQAPSLLALRGVILLRQGEAARADEMFVAALGEVHTRQDGERNQRGRDFALLDLEGLARCGLAISGGRRDPDEFSQAARSFRAARELTRAPGIVARLLRLLCELDESGRWDAMLVALRAASGAAEPSDAP